MKKFPEQPDDFGQTGERTPRIGGDVETEWGPKKLMEKAKEMWEKEAEEAEKGGFYGYAAGIHEKNGNQEKARELWEREAEELEKKAEEKKKEEKDFFDRNKNIIRLGDSKSESFKFSYFREAAEAYMKAGNKEKAKEMEERDTVKWPPVLQIDKKTEDKEENKSSKEFEEKSTEEYEKIAVKNKRSYHHSLAAEAFEKAGKKEEAKEMWEIYARGREYAAKSVDMMYKPEEAKRTIVKAAEAYEKADNKDKAREMWKMELETQKYGKNYRGIAMAYENLARLAE